MKPTPIIIGIVALLAVAGTALYFSTNPGDETLNMNLVNTRSNVNVETGNRNINTNASPSTTNQEPSLSAQYIPYSEAAFASAKASVPQGGDVVLYFHADWCPICRVLDPDIVENLNNLPQGLTILKVNYDRETALKSQYGVTYQHTFVQVNENGDKLKLWSGSTNANDISNQVL